MPLRAILLAAFALALHGQPLIQGPVVVLVGAPGAGKTTQAAALSKIYGLPVISSEDLIKNNPNVFQKIRESKLTGMEPQTDPVLNKLFLERIKQGDAAAGVIVAGYPATKDHADFLAKMVADKSLPVPTILQLDVPDDDVRKRLASNPEYTPAKLDQLLKDYHREFDMLKLYFPNAEVTTIDGRPKIEQVTNNIQALLDKKIKKK